MINRITLLLFIGLAWGQDEYPYFSNPKKSFEFEKKRIYINEEKGRTPTTFGGGSIIKLANPLYRLTGDDPDYVSSQLPTRTTFKYYHNFSIEQDGVNISELDLLHLLGLKKEREDIINNHRIKLIEYNQEVIEFEKSEKYYYTTKEVRKNVIEDYFGFDTCFGTCCALGVIPLLMWMNGDEEAGATTSVWAVSIVSILYLSSVDYTVTEKTKHKRIPPTKPQIEQTLTNEQIKSLINTYNRNLYNEIAKK